MRRGLAVQQDGGFSGIPEPDPASFADLEELPVEVGGREGQVGVLDEHMAEVQG